MKYIKQPKRYLVLEDDEWRVLVKGLNEFRKQIIDAPTKKIKVMEV